MFCYNPFPELVLEPNHTNLLLMPLLSSLVIWLAKKLLVLNTFNFFTVFQDSAQLVHTIVDQTVLLLQTMSHSRTLEQNVGLVLMQLFTLY